jgi:hypothetical protein
MVGYEAIIVTAANQLYWRCLYQFLRNMERRRLHRRHRIIAYDLGLQPQTLALLERRFGWCEFRRFRFEDHPPHVAVEAGAYAWKPLIVAEVVEAADGPVIWGDSATLFLTGDLSPVLEDIRRCGAWAAHGQAMLEERCDLLVLETFEVPVRSRRRPEIMAGLAAFDAGNPEARQLVRDWAAHACIEAHINPRQPPWRHHKMDQALLTILMFAAEDRGRIRLPGGEIDISSANPVRWVSTRNIVGPDVPRWADPLARLYYFTYKTVDRWLWRYKHWRQGRYSHSGGAC